jgi:hypothetical protein
MVRAENWPNPVLECATCHAKTDVPTTNAALHLKNAKKTTVEFVDKTSAAVKKEYEHLKSKPKQFNCEHCNTLLAVPPPQPWTCATCSVSNEALLESCASCSTKRVEQPQLVLCGVCSNPTKVPSTNFENIAKANLKDLDKSAKKIYYDLAGKPYVLCPRCAQPMKLKTVPKRASTEAKHHEASSSSSQKKDMSIEEEAMLMLPKDGAHKETTETKEQKEGAETYTIAETQPGAGQELECTACKENIVVPIDQKKELQASTTSSSSK